MKNILQLSWVFTVLLFLNHNTVWAQSNCNTALQVSNLTGSPCATASPQATNTLTPAVGSCVDGTNDTWFYFVAQGGSATVTVSSTTSNFNPEFLVLSSSNNSCTGTLTEQACADQNGNYASINTTVNGLTIGATYWIVVTSGNGTSSGTISACVNNPPIILNCVDNDACLDAATITLNAPVGTASSTPACLTDCNNGANVGLDFVGNNCEDMNNPTVWYEFTTSSNAAAIDINLTSATMTNPEFTIYQGNACTSPWTIVECFEGASGAANLNNIPVSANTTYLIAVSDASGDQGTFQLCVVQDPDNSACNTTDALTVTSTSMGSPLTGPYQPGEQVTFCYTITNWTQTNCNYLGAVVPSFGNCWDPSSFNAQGMPVVINTPLAAQGVIQPCGPGPPCAWASCAGTASGAWSWFPAGSATYNVNGYYAVGTPMPAGWYFLSSYDPLTGACNGNDPTDPDNSFGDGSFPACGTNTLDYTVCFTLTAGPYGNCGTGLTDCSVSIKTFADGEFGAWNNIGCTADLPITLPASLICCSTVVNAGSDQSLCSGGSLGLNGSYSSTTGSVTVAWTASPASALTGLSSTTSLTPTFTPPAGVTGPVTFTLSITDAICTKTDQVVITVNPLPTISGTLTVCKNATSQLTGSGIPATSNPWTSSNTTVATISSTGLVTALSAGTTTITYTNSNGCQITALFTVNPLPTITGTLTACVNGTSQLTGSASPAVSNPWTSSNTSVAAVSSTGLVSALAAGTTTITYTNNNGCQITAVFTVNPLPTITGTLTACVNGISQLTGSATPATTNPWTSSNTTVATISSTGSVTALSVGTTTITYTNSNGCQVTAVFTVNPLPTISGTLSACVNGTSQLTGSASPAVSNPWTSSNGLVATVTSSGLVTALSAGTTTITYTNSNGCQITALFIVNPLPTISGALNACINGTSQLTGSATPATLNPWLSSNTAVATISSTGLVTGISAGTSTITYTNSNGCQITTLFTVNPLPTITGTLSACVNSTSQLLGSATPAITNPWISSNTSVATISSTGLVTALSIGTTTITYTNNNGCQVTMLFTVNPLPTITGTLTACVNGTSQLSGSATPSVSNPWISSSTAVATVSSTGLVTALSAGTTTITYTNNNGCQITALFTVNPLPTISGTLTACVNGTSQLTGSATPSTSNPWLSSNTSVATINSTGLVTGISAGTSTITYTNSNGCQVTTLFTVNPLPTATISGGGQYCAGTTPAPVTVAVTGTPNWTVHYTLNGIPLQITSGSSPISLGTAAGTYVLTDIHDLGCTSTASGTQVITINPLPTTTISGGGIYCAGQPIGNVNVALTGTSSWTINYTLNGVPTSISSSTSPVSLGNTSGTYVLTSVTDANCSNTITGSQTITVNPIPTASISGGDVYCTGETPSDIIVSLTGSPIFTVNYTLDGVPGSISSTSTTISLGDEPGIYTLTSVSDALCTSSTSGTQSIVFNPAPIITTSSFDPSSCNGTDGSIQVSGVGTGSVNWSGTASGSSGVVMLPYTLSDLSAGTYFVTFTDNTSGCVSLPLQTHVNNPGAPLLTIIPDYVQCGGAYSLPVIGGSGLINPQYYTLPGGPAGGGTLVAAGTVFNAPISQTLYAYDANGACVDEEQFVITLNAVPTASITGGSSVCTGTTPSAVQVSLTGTPHWIVNYTLNGTPLVATGPTSPISLGNAPGTYSITSISDENCSNTTTGSQTITILPLPTATISGGGTFCSGQPVTAVTATLTGTGPWTVNYTLNGVPQTISGNSSPLSLGSLPGVYVLTSVTDANCTGSASGTSTIVINPLPTAAISGGGVYCTGTTPSPIQLNLTGTGPWLVNYTINGVALNSTVSSSPFSLGNAAGTYILTGITDVNCTNGASGTQTITVNPLPTASISGGGTYCAGQSPGNITVALTGTPNWTVNYTLNGVPQAISGITTSPVSLGNTPGIYVLTGVSNALCSNTASGSQTISINALPTASIAGGNVYCSGQPVAPITASLTGTSNWQLSYTFNGTPTTINVTSSPVILGNSAGTYVLTGLSDANCSNVASGSQVITVNPLPTATISGGGTFCAGQSASPVFVTLTGNPNWTINYTLNGSPQTLSGVTTSPAQLGNTSGTYAITNIIDGNLCTNTASGSQSIVINPLPTATISGGSVYCAGQPVSPIQVAVTGTSTWVVNYTLNGTPQTLSGAGSPINLGTAQGIYELTGISDANCTTTASGTQTITVNTLPTATISGGGTYCVGQSVGNVSVALTGTPNWTVNYTLNGTPQTLSGITTSPVSLGNTPGTYVLTGVADALCSTTANGSQTITVNQLPTATITGGGVYCAGQVVSPITVALTGTPNWQLNYTIDGAANSLNVTSSPVILGTSQGVYTLTSITDANCTSSLSASETITINPLPTFTLSSANPSACNVSDGAIIVSGLSSNANYEISYVFNSQQQSVTTSSSVTGTITISNLAAGQYSSIAVTLLATGCEGVSTQVLTLVNPNSPVLNQVADVSSCDSYTLPSINGSNLGALTSYYTGSNASGNQLNVGDLITSSDSIYVYTINGQCSDEVGFVITINQTPSITNPGDQLACETVDLPMITGFNLSNNAGYFDNSQLNGGQPITGPITANQTVWMYDANGACSDEESFVVVIYALPELLTLTGGGVYCEGEPVDPVVATFSGNPTFELMYTLNGTPQTISSSSTSVSLGSTPGEYIVQMLTDAACSTNVSGTINLIINQLPEEPVVGPSETYCLNWVPQPLSAEGSGGQLTWYQNPSLSQITDNIPDAVEGTTTYYVTETQSGCEGPAASVSITFENCDITVPTAFTPDGDNINDYWEIIDLDLVYPNNIVRVFNRWGNLLYESKKGEYSLNPWRGDYEGSQLPVGSYYFIIEFNDEISEPRKGIVSIVLN